LYDPTDETLWWPKDGAGDNLFVNEITIDTLAAGTYLIYLRDDAGFTLATCCRPVRFDICEPDSLILETVELVSNVACLGDSTGAIKITASGGTAPYEYNYTRTTLFDDNYQYKGEESINHDLWQTSDTITGLPAGAYIGWVRDINGCITGCEINSQGLPIDDHRVVIREAGAVVVDSVYVDEPLCYGGAASIELWGVTGGSGETLTFQLAGTTYDGVDTVFVFDPMPFGEEVYALDDVVASDENGYVLTLWTDLDCEASGDTIWVGQPETFEVEMVIASGALCPGDSDVLVVLEVTGGTAPFKFDIYQNGVLVRENSSNVNHIMYVGSEYKVVAKDALGCEAEVIELIPVPVEVDFTVQDVSCHGDELASVWVNVTATTEGRTHLVRFSPVIPNQARVWSEWIEFDNELIIDTMSYGHETEWDGHYVFQVKDDGGCPAVEKFLTFVPVQHPLELDVRVVEEGECLTEVEVRVFGGMPPYYLSLDGEPVEAGTHFLPVGDYELVLTDKHVFCSDTAWFSIVTHPVVRDVEVETYFGVEYHFVDEEAGVDEMLVEDSTYVYTYMYEECERTLNVTVLGIPRPIVAIADVQGEAVESPLKDEIVRVIGTVTGVSPGEGFFMQDDNAAWSGIWVAYSDAADLEIGDGVDVIGEVAEVSDVTTILATEVTIIDAPVTVVPVVVDSPSAAKDEMYESVLVQVEGARAMAANDIGQWTIYYESVDNAVVNKWFYEYSPEEGTFYHVTGIVNGRMDNFWLEPRMESDIVDLGVTSVPIITDGTFNPYVYPNPFNDYINIHEIEKLTRVVVSNIAGQRVLDIEYPTQGIRTANLVSGVYVVSMFTEDGLAKTERIVKR